jgi:hypothetical protein
MASSMRRDAIESVFGKADRSNVNIAHGTTNPIPKIKMDRKESNNSVRICNGLIGFG